MEMMMERKVARNKDPKIRHKELGHKERVSCTSRGGNTL
jgi:hypothetical protein